MMLDPILRKAEELSETGDHNAAIEILRDLAMNVADATGDVHALYLRALLNGRRTRMALDHALHVTTRFPEDAELFMLLAFSYFRLERYAEAEQAYDEALKLDGELVHALTGRAHSLLRLGRTAEAISILRQAQDGRPPDYGLMETLGSIQLHSKDLQAARSSFERAAELDPTESSSFLGLANVSFAEGKPEDALEQVRRSLLLDRGDYHAHFLHAYILFKLRQNSQALAALEDAFQLAPYRMEVARPLILAHLKRGRIRKAIRLWGVYASAVKLNEYVTDYGRDGLNLDISPP